MSGAGAVGITLVGMSGNKKEEGAGTGSGPGAGAGAGTMVATLPPPVEME